MVFLQPWIDIERAEPAHLFDDEEAWRSVLAGVRSAWQTVARFGPR